MNSVEQSLLLPVSDHSKMMNDQEAELIPFEIVREEERHVVIRPSRWQMLTMGVIGLVLLVGIFTVGFVVAGIVLVLGIPLLIARRIFASMSRR